MEKIMESKTTKTNTKMNQKLKSIRVSSENKKRAEHLRNLANKKRFGRKVKIDQVLSLALDLVTEDHLKMLQDQSLSHEDRKELLRQKYIEERGPISKDDFTGFTLTAEFQIFLKAQASMQMDAMPIPEKKVS
jgi:hypothetical protein